MLNIEKTVENGCVVCALEGRLDTVTSPELEHELGAAVEGATYVVEPDGECRFNKAKLLQDRQIFLSYKYVKAGETWHVKDTLSFRNRIRDGVNEWQDENQEAYR